MTQTNVTPLNPNPTKPRRGKPRWQERVEAAEAERDQVRAEFRAYVEAAEAERDQVRAEFRAYVEAAEASAARRPSPPPVVATVILGIVMPVFSVAFSGIAGALALAGGWVAFGFVTFAGISGLVVSLQHVADTIRRTTGSHWRLSWLLAIGLEVGIVGLELGHVTCPEVVPAEVVRALMVLLAVLVAGANVLAFLAHRRVEASR